MQVRSRLVANLLIPLFLNLSVNQAGLAQAANYGNSAFARVLSAQENSAGNFLLLNLQSRSVLTAPLIQYLPGPDGKTVMVSDFHGVIWSGESQLIRPQAAGIESVRLGQFQSSPPVFRISITTANPALLKDLEFKSQEGSLILKFPGSDNPILASSYNRVKKPAKNAAMSRFGDSSKKQQVRAETKQTASMRSGGLYMQISRDGGGSGSGANTDPPLAAPFPEHEPSAKQASYGAINLKTLPPLAADYSVAKGKSSSVLTAPVPGSASSAMMLQPSNPGNEDIELAKPIRAAESSVQKAQLTPAVSGPGRAKPEPKGYKRLQPQEDRSSLSEEKPIFPSSEKGPTAATNPVSSAVESLEPNPTLEFSGGEPWLLNLKFKTAQAPSYKAFRLEDPPRYVIDLENLSDGLCPANQDPPSNQYLKSLRFGVTDEGGKRIVLDLTDPEVQVKEKFNAERALLCLSLTRGPQMQTRKFTVVVDAGHGGSDPGAQRGDIQEKEITLAIALQLKRLLEGRGVRVIMTRSDDSFVSLEDRVKLTNEIAPDAFVSVHINSLETDRDIQGIETYYQTEQSRRLAEQVHKQLLGKLSVPDRSVRKARFYVVNHTERPSILAELGFISNKDERDKLISSEYQAKVAESLGEGVILFLTDGAGISAETAMQAKRAENVFKISEGSKQKKALAKDDANAVKHVAASSVKNADSAKKAGQIAQSNPESGRQAQ